MAGNPRIALAQINTTPGDIPGNRDLILTAWRRAGELGAHLVVTPELALPGYCPRDLLFRHRFVEGADQALDGLREATAAGPALVVGTVRRRSGPGRPFQNVAVWLEGGAERACVAKSLLPVYDVFDEARYFEAGAGSEPIPFRGARIGITVCEDLWIDPQNAEAPGYAEDPAARLAALGADAIVNLSASPFHSGKSREREAVVARAARRTGRPVLLCNLWGGNDEILFDGASVAMRADGTVSARGAAFADDLVVVDLDGSPPVRASDGGDPVEELRRALVLGIADYARKCRFTDAVIGLSGGIDSALTAALTVEALGARHVRGVGMPSRFSSRESVEDAEDLARRLGISFSVVSIDAAYEEIVRRARDVVGEGPFGVMEENIQARLRGVILMAVSNRTGALLITTGNKSELAVGYCTLYGDMCGGLAAISDVYKTDVWRLSRRYVDRGMIPERSYTKPPSAELRPGQKDQDSLPPYDLLDRILALHVDEGFGTRDIVSRIAGAPRETVDRVLALVARNEYKRKQAAPGLRVSRKAFGYGRRIPLVASSLGFLDAAGADPAPKPGTA